MEEIVCAEDQNEGRVVDVGPKIIKVRYKDGTKHHYDRAQFTHIPKPGDKFRTKITMYITEGSLIPDVKEELPKAGRKFAKISVEEFRLKINEAVSKHESYEPWEPDGKPIREPINYAHNILDTLTPTVEKDLSKVRVANENTLWEEGDDAPMLGFHQLDNGLTFLGVQVGGDWESPVFFVLYWDGSKIRGYIPTLGNPWNRTTKQAFGNDEDADREDAKRQFPGYDFESENFGVSDIEPEWDKIEADVRARIVDGAE
jgi:hypothetical protein